MAQDDQALADLRTLAELLANTPTSTGHPTYVIVHNRATGEVLGLDWDAPSTAEEEDEPCAP